MRIPYEKTLVLFLLGWVNLSGQSTEIKFERLSVEHGLSQSSASVIMQDSQGFMWFGTQDGLNKYDGINFTIYRHDPLDTTTISGNYIGSLCEDKDGLIWVATGDGGLDRFDVKKGIFEHFRAAFIASSSSNAISVRRIYRDKLGNIWFATSQGLARFNKLEKQFKFFLIETAGAESQAISAIFEDNEGIFWIGARGKLFTFDRNKNRFLEFTIKVSREINFISAIYEDSFGLLWLGTSPAGLIHYDRTSAKFKLFQNDLNDSHILGHNAASNIVEDKKGDLWFGTESSGLNRLNRSDGTFSGFLHDPLNPNSLSNNIVMSLLTDNSGTLWIGTSGGGINKYDPNKVKFAHYKNDLRSPDTLGGNMVWSIFKDSERFIWAGTQMGGLTRFDPESDDYKVFKHDPSDSFSLSSDAVFAIQEDKAGAIWVGTNGGGLNKFNKKTGKFKRFEWDSENSKSLSSNRIKTLYFDQNGTLWIGTLGGGLNKLDPDSMEFTRYVNDPENPGSISSNAVSSIFEDMEGNIWIGTIGGGLNYFDKRTETFSRYLYNPDANSLSHNYVMSICEQPSGILWIGTNYGLNRFDPETNDFKHYTTRDGLPNNVIYGVLADDRGNLWISSNRGLSRFDPRTGTFNNYDIDDGLQSFEFNSGACFKSTNGEMFFGGVNGFNVFHPDSVKDNPNVPPVVISNFKKFDQRFRLGDVLTEFGLLKLSYKDNFITFEFAALDYTNPQKNQYAYQLEGLHDNWIYSGNQRYATFTNLDPGEYVFRVKGANSDGVWNERGASVRILITPPFWKTWWFMWLAICLSLTALLLVVMNLRERAKKKAELNKKISELKLQALRAQMNPHFVFNTLNSIQYFISSNERKAAYHYLSKFSKLMRRVLDNAEKSKLPISEELDSLKLYLELESLRFEGKFNYKIDVDAKIDVHNIEIPTLLIQPFVENAIHHGLRFKRSNGTLHVQISLEDNSIICIIEDNGIGIQKALKSKNKNGGHKPVGLKVSQERLATLNELRKNGRGVEIIDLAKTNGGTGTRVKIVIPIEDA